PSMVLLPELLYRHAFGRPLLTVPSKWMESPGQVPILDEDDDWVALGRTWVPQHSRARQGSLEQAVRSVVKGRPRLRAGLKEIRVAVRWCLAGSAPIKLRLDWQAAQHDQEYWPETNASLVPAHQ